MKRSRSLKCTTGYDSEGQSSPAQRSIRLILLWQSLRGSTEVAGSLIYGYLPIRISMVLVFLVSFQTNLAAQPVAQTKNREIIRQARGSYYNLTQHGFVEFQSSIQPNWEVVLAEQL